MSENILLEVCVDSPEGLASAIAGGADRIELCAALETGGLTPSPGLMALAAKAPIPVYAMIRTRPGDFVYADKDMAALLADVDAVRAAGLAGVVLGASHADGSLDREVLARLAAHARGLGMTLHRAFDLAGPDFAPAIDLAVELGFERILTSGGETTALKGLGALAACFAHAGDRIAIMPGSGVNLETLGAIKARLPFREIHSSCSVAVDAPAGKALELGFVSPRPKHTDAGIVRKMRAALDRL
ncbi:copper homeostasis protein CutC [Aminobacter niigataensis]|uniref:copper homeostasis protein CutC n=1 Tax=Aminobacter niigataensis TaxID=83265 RepID=UPI0024C85F5A|nr:copper homeostasis protein CutC [Aminobacter niigataensis]CAI2931487.1 Copper homeostasis protein CutC [Aminobacter niigataensis]